jgi:GWxTD domain-containing protein
MDPEDEIMSGETACRTLAAAFLAACLCFPPRAGSQVEIPQASLDEALGSVFVDAITFSDARSGKSRIDVFVQVGYDLLSFVRAGELYSASYELTLSVYDSTEALVGEKLWTEEIRDIAFDRTVSRTAYSLTQRSFVVAPGSYVVSVQFRDRESNTTRTLVRRLLVTDFAATTFSMSDVMLLSRVTEQEGRKSIVPNVSPNVGNITEPFWMYFEMYNSRDLDSVRLVVDVLTSGGERKLEFDTLAAVRPERNESFLRVDHTGLPLGDYRLYVRAYPADSTAPGGKEMLAGTNRAFSVRWAGFPWSVDDIDRAIDQVRYIARDEELSELKDAKTAETKQAKLIEFWKKRDPNPNTPRNERMEDYYQRVEYANKQFTHYIEGWRTDMGMVYIMFGPPNDVSRYPFEVDSKPYEVWRYYDINYDFVFVDQSGFGDYRLTTPIWEAWQRTKH